MTFHRFWRQKRAGFTIVELIVVIVVIGILASITILSFGAWQQNTVVNQLKSDLNGAASAMENYNDFNNTYPACVTSPNSCAGFTPSSGDTLSGGGRSDGLSYCIQVVDSSFPTLTYYIDSSNGNNGPQPGTCSVLASVSGLNVAAVGGSNTQLNLTWTVVTGATGYTVQCALDSGFTTGLASSTPTITSVTLSGLSSYTYYYCRVQATNGSSTSAWSNTVTATTNGVWTWAQQTGSTSQLWTAVASSSDGTHLVAIGSGYIYTSTNSGVTWTQQTAAGSRVWSSVASSSDGTKLVAGVQSGYIYTSTNSGVTWTQQTGSGSAIALSIASSSDGTKLAAAANSGYIYTSTDSGVTWTHQTSSALGGTNEFVASSSDGTKLAAAANSGYIYTSTNSGVTWTQQTGSGSRGWDSIASSSDGTKLAAAANSGYIYTSTDSGVTWTQQTAAGSRVWDSVASSSDGTKLVAGVLGGYIYTSTDSGVTWTQQTAAGSRVWDSVASSSDGTKLVAGDETPGYIYTGVYQ